MPSRGTFIVIEGLDRSGKSTQTALLHEKIAATIGPTRVKMMKFPERTTPIGKMIDSYLRSQSELDDRAIHLLFSANRWELATSIKTDLEAGINIVCDRYAFSGAAFSIAKGLPYEWCISPDIALPSPDLVIFLDVSPEVVQSRGGFGAERYEKEEMQREVRKVFERLQKHSPSPPWTVIDAGGFVEDVKAAIWQTVEQMVTGGLDSHLTKLWVQ